MNFYQAIRNTYINTFRRSRLVHRTLYRIARTILFPTWERIRAFHTHPDDPLSLRFSMLSGGYEKETVRLVKTLIKPGMVVLDIGAHVGYYTRIFSKLVGGQGRVIAFEPHPETFRLLTWNCSTLNNVTTLEIAAADEEAILTLYDGQLETGMSGLRHLGEYKEWTKQLSTEATPRALKGYPLRFFSVRARPVDQCLSELGIMSADFVKMDIEGAEIRAVKGMQKLLAASSLIMVMEFNPRLLQSFGVSPQEAIRTLRSYGFASIEVIDKVLKPIDEETEEFFRLTEYLVANFSMVNLLCRKS